MNFHEQPVFAVIITGCGKSCVKRGDARCDPGDPGWPQANCWISNFLVFVGTCFISTKHSSFSAPKWKKNLKKKKRIECFNATNLWREKKNNSFSNYSNQNSGRVQLRITEFNTVHISNQSVNDLSSRFSPRGRQMVTVSNPEQRWEQDLGVSQQGWRGGAGSAARRSRPCPSDF